MKITVCSLWAQFHNSSFCILSDSSLNCWISQDEHCVSARSLPLWQTTERPHRLLLFEHSYVLLKSRGSWFPDPAPQTGYSFSSEQTFCTSERPLYTWNIPKNCWKCWTVLRLTVWKEACSQNISTATVLLTSGHLPYVRGAWWDPDAMTYWCFH